MKAFALPVASQSTVWSTRCVPAHIIRHSSFLFPYLKLFVLRAGTSDSDTGKWLFCVETCLTLFLCQHLTLPSFLSPSFTDDRTCVIFPLVKAFCEKCFKGDEAVLASLSFQYGKLCHGLSGQCHFPFYVFLKYFTITVMSWIFVPFVWTESFTDEQHLWFLEFYKKLCCLGLQHENGHCESQPYPLELENKYALVRRNCAYNFPVSFPALHP